MPRSPAVYRNYYPEGSVAPMLKIGLSNKLPHFFGSHFYLMKSNAAYDAPVSDERIRWPVLLMSHGLKGYDLKSHSGESLLTLCSLPETYITLGEQLASEGFVVRTEDMIA
jgi:predicted dienelactone hydrolase